MLTQTIALFRYQLLGILNARIMLLLLIIYSVSFLLGQFVGELAIINSERIALALTADFLRYSLVLVVVVVLCYQVSQDYELSQFDRLLAMPVSRGQYILAQNLLLLFFAGLLMVLAFFLLLPLASPMVAFYWSIAVLLELVLVGQFAMLAILSLEKLPVAVLFALAIYLLAKSTPLLDLILTQTSAYYDQQSGFQLSYALFNLIQYVLPDASAFAQNNLIFQVGGELAALGNQMLSVLVYSLFIEMIILIDFYRKEFNQL